MRLQIWSLMVGVLFLGSCQSSRLAVITPGTGAYTQSASVAPIQLVAPVGLTATTTASMPDVAEPSAHKFRLPPSRQRQPTPPDTIRTTGAAAPVAAKPDPLTTGVNVAGAIATAGSAGFFIAAADRNQGSSDYFKVFQILVGIGLLGVGIPLLFFQGKNGRRRLAREARQGKPKPADAPKDTVANRPLMRTGIGLGLVGLLLLLVGALLGGLALVVFGIPALILLLVGIVMLLAGS